MNENPVLFDSLKKATHDQNPKEILKYLNRIKNFILIFAQITTQKTQQNTLTSKQK